MSGFLESSDGTRHAVEDGMVIGRDKRAGIVLTDAKCSRRHAQLISQGGVVEIEDLDSSNGTRLNGKPIEKRMLRDGDVVQIGKTELTFREAVEAAPAGGGGDFGAGEDLFGDDAPEPAPTLPKPQPAPTAPPREEPKPAPVAEPQPKPQPARQPEPQPEPRPQPKPEPFEPVVEVRPPKDAAPAPEPEEEVLEFADDDVVMVKRTLPKQAGKAAPAPTRDGGVLQFHKIDDKKSIAAHDMTQMAFPMRALLVVVAVAAAAGLFYLAMKFASG